MILKDDFEDADEIAMFEEWIELMEEGYLNKSQRWKWYKNWCKRWNEVRQDVLIQLNI